MKFSILNEKQLIEYIKINKDKIDPECYMDFLLHLDDIIQLFHTDKMSLENIITLLKFKSTHYSSSTNIFSNVITLFNANISFDQIMILLETNEYVIDISENIIELLDSNITFDQIIKLSKYTTTNNLIIKSSANIIELLDANITFDQIIYLINKNIDLFYSDRIIKLLDSHITFEQIQSLIEISIYSISDHHELIVLLLNTKQISFDEIVDIFKCNESNEISSRIFNIIELLMQTDLTFNQIRSLNNVDCFALLNSKGIINLLRLNVSFDQIINLAKCDPVLLNDITNDNAINLLNSNLQIVDLIKYDFRLCSIVLKKYQSLNQNIIVKIISVIDQIIPNFIEDFSIEDLVKFVTNPDLGNEMFKEAMQKTQALTKDMTKSLIKNATEEVPAVSTESDAELTNSNTCLNALPFEIGTEHIAKYLSSRDLQSLSIINRETASKSRDFKQRIIDERNKKSNTIHMS